jgi:hypothetical protein
MNQVATGWNFAIRTRKRVNMVGAIALLAIVALLAAIPLLQSTHHTAAFVQLGLAAVLVAMLIWLRR